LRNSGGESGKDTLKYAKIQSILIMQATDSALPFRRWWIASD
jgi:hypothetical protein